MVPENKNKKYFKRHRYLYLSLMRCSVVERCLRLVLVQLVLVEYKEQGWPMVQLFELVVTELLRKNEHRKYMYWANVKSDQCDRIVILTGAGCG